MQYNKNSDKEQYIAIPIWFIKLTSHKKSPNYLTPFECQLYWLIRGLCNGKECYANDQYFANTFNVTIKHINKSIHKLELLRMVFINHRNNKRFIAVSLIDRGSMFYFTDKNKVCITTENNFLQFTYDEWGEKTENERDVIFMSKAV